MLNLVAILLDCSCVESNIYCLVQAEKCWKYLSESPCFDWDCTRTYGEVNISNRESPVGEGFSSSEFGWIWSQTSCIYQISIRIYIYTRTIIYVYSSYIMLYLYNYIYMFVHWFKFGEFVNSDSSRFENEVDSESTSTPESVCWGQTTLNGGRSMDLSSWGKLGKRWKTHHLKKSPLVITAGCWIW